MGRKNGSVQKDDAHEAVPPSEPQPETEPTNGHPDPDPRIDRQPPVATFRYGRVKATVWCNVTDRGPFFAVTIARIYKIEATNEWAQSYSLGRDDLLPAAEAARQAWAWIHAQQQADGSVPF